jgi:predicted dehydrogenase
MKGILVGLGGRARSWVNCSAEKDVEFDAYVEPMEKQKKNFADQYSVPEDRIFSSLSEAIEKSDAQFVMDITPPHIHEAIAMEAFDAGLHVIGEKPLSDDFDAAKRMVAAAKKAGLVHMITQNYRFGGMPRTTHRLLKEGVIGEPEQVLVTFFMSWADSPGSHYVTQPYMLIKDMGVHHFDLLRYVLDRDAESVLAHTWNPSWGWHEGDASHTAIFKMSGGLIATHHALGCAKGHRTTYNGDWHIAGNEGSITWEGSQVFITHGHKTKNEGREEVTLDKPAEDGQKGILTEFISSIHEGRAPECNSEDNLNSLVMTFATVESAEQQKFVDIAPMLG